MLTPSQVANAKPQANPFKLHDERGLFLLVTSAGGKLWRFKYRRPETGKENLLSLGAYPAVSLKRAREKREEARALLADGDRDRPMSNNAVRSALNIPRVINIQGNHRPWALHFAFRSVHSRQAAFAAV